jgi:hypothetical protein
MHRFAPEAIGRVYENRLRQEHGNGSGPSREEPMLFDTLFAAYGRIYQVHGGNNR